MLKFLIINVFFLFISIYIPNNLFAQKDSINKLFEMSIDELMQVKVITASKRNELVKTAPAIVSIINQDEIKRIPGSTLTDLLENIPGIEVSLSSEGLTRVSIRGIRHNGEILLLIDGYRLNNFYSGNSIYNIPVELIEKVEIIRGPGSALYGTNAFIGIINVITKKNQNSIEIEGGNTFGKAFLHYGKNIHLKNDSLKLFIQAGINYSDAYNIRIDDDIESSKIWSYTYKTKTGRTNLWLNEVFSKINISYKTFEASGFFHNRQNGPYVGPAYIIAPDSRYEQNRFVGFAKYEWKLSKQVSIIPKIYGDILLNNNYIQETPKGYIGNPSGQIFYDGRCIKEKYTAKTIGFENQINYSLNRFNEITAGVLAEHLLLSDFDILRNYRISDDSPKQEFGIYDNIELNQNNKFRNIFAVFIQDKIKIKNINFTLGLRYDKYSDFGDALSPRFSFLWNINNHYTIKLLYGRAFRAPTFQELYDRSKLGQDGIFGKENLKPEIINSYELGIEFLTKRINIRTNFFYNQATNLIRPFDPWGNGGAGWYENIGSIDSYGAETDIICLIASNLHVTTNLSYFYTLFNWNKDVKQGSYYYDGTQLKNIPLFRINTKINYSYKKWNFNVGINYGASSSNNSREAVEKAQKVNIPMFITGNFKISYQLKNNILLNISGINLINDKYSDPTELNSINAFGSKGLLQPNNLFMAKIIYQF